MREEDWSVAGFFFGRAASERTLSESGVLSTVEGWVSLFRVAIWVVRQSQRTVVVGDDGDLLEAVEWRRRGQFRGPQERLSWQRHVLL